MTFSASTNSWARNGGTAPLKMPEQAAVPEAPAEEQEQASEPEADKDA